MTDIRVKTDRLIEAMEELKDDAFKACGDSITDMEVEEFAMLKKALDLIDYSIDLAVEQARVIEENDRILNELNRKMDILLDRKG